MDNRQPQRPDRTSAPKGTCPYCGSDCWGNSWGEGNARCLLCNQECVVKWIHGKVIGEALPYRPGK